MNEEDTLIEVYAGTYLEASIIQGLLEANGIRAFLRDQTLGVIAPYHAAPGGVGAVKVLVASKDVEAARSLIEAAPDSAHREEY